MITRNALPLLFLCSVAAACGGPPNEDTRADDATEGIAAPLQGTVAIINPLEGEVLEGTDVTVWLRSSVPIVPAGDMMPGTGHHHLYLDADLGDMSAPIPSVAGSIVHLGNAALEYVFENATSGPHRLIAVVADGAHVALQPLVVDTVMFVVE